MNFHCAASAMYSSVFPPASVISVAQGANILGTYIAIIGFANAETAVAPRTVMKVRTMDWRKRIGLFAAAARSCILSVFVEGLPCLSVVGKRKKDFW